MRKIFTVLCGLLLLATPLFAQDKVYDFLNLERSAKVAALGGNSVSFIGDLNAFFQNPAVLNSNTNRRGAFSFQKHLMDINSGFAVYGRSIESIGDFAAGVSYVNYGSFDETDELGNIIGSFAAQDLALQIGYAFDLEEYDYGYLRAGISLKYIYSNIADYTSSALALDAGIVLVIPESDVEIGFALTNYGWQLAKYDAASEDLPTDMRLALTTRPEGLPLALTIGLVQLNNDFSLTEKVKNFTIGGEFSFGEFVRFRLGFNNALRNDVKSGENAGMVGASAGLGILYRDFHFDYSYSSWGSIGALHQFSISTTL
ncbi:hypothetical protein Ctha_0030 [Chloroherpeton thalassium ATCC 35110]|uniref:Type IX secretion system protein PorQ n=1 Tax=Chloroherpeton thalassium (strain ATCC 35110 / GB-78) TaxID=517418 RepID=B3QSB1_CHLT3|nr:type IX secretion system protein PorQ [Chloroherpeton thalassium]ACF12502.1 hypothetical protein Ctha_0030 [Chloroherpeton thalassium ATCC 35110]